MNREAMVQTLQAHLPGLLAVYAFGSGVQGTAGPGSDLDLAVLVEGYVTPVELFDLAGELADLAGAPVDLVDLRAASTVMQCQILTTGQRWWARDVRAALCEAAMLSEKTELDRARAGLRSGLGHGPSSDSPGEIGHTAKRPRCVCPAGTRRLDRSGTGRQTQTHGGISQYRHAMNTRHCSCPSR
ncbi:MAG: nucleotidyltransferase domain-containing protein [Methylacidiphilaceae bacterium]|nr:nucleotidyltransferase domain-containing protein [Candidatus Methylacidiphilaceae bacterium]